MQTIQHFIETAIQNHVLDIEHSDYEQIETIIGRKRVEKLSFYLESSQEELFELLLKEILENNEQIERDILSLIPKEEPTESIEKEMNPEGKTCTIFYGTNREPNDINDISKGYGNGRSKKLHLGSCQVHVPKSHNIGELSGSLWNKLIHFDFSYGAVELKTIQSLEDYSFWEEISTLFNPLEEEEKQAIVFIHGFNTSFEEAAIRATQISVDVQHTGVTAFFSWPSKGKPLSYLSDEATVQYSEKFLTEFLIDFAQKSGANRVHIIAHSMGNRALLEAVNRIQREAPEIQFGQIILAAPDVDADVFEELAQAYTLLSEQTTLYVSEKDKAVGVSKWLHSHARAGFTPPLCIVNQINSVEVESIVRVLELGHGYFAGHKTILSDMYQLMQFNLDANNREYLLPKELNQFNRYWKLRSV